MKSSISKRIIDDLNLSHQELENIITTLPPIEEIVFRQRYYLNMTCPEISKIVRKDESYIHRIEFNAVIRIAAACKRQRSANESRNVE